MFTRVFLPSLGTQVCEALEEKLKNKKQTGSTLGSLSDMCSETLQVASSSKVTHNSYRVVIPSTIVSCVGDLYLLESCAFVKICPKCPGDSGKDVNFEVAGFRRTEQWF